jgi:hypothetical protein
MTAMSLRNQLNIPNADAGLARPGAVAPFLHGRIVVIENAFVTPTWRTGGQRGQV